MVLGTLLGSSATAVCTLTTELLYDKNLRKNKGEKTYIKNIVLLGYGSSCL